MNQYRQNVPNTSSMRYATINLSFAVGSRDEGGTIIVCLSARIQRLTMMTMMQSTDFHLCLLFALMVSVRPYRSDPKELGEFPSYARHRHRAYKKDFWI